MGLCFFGEEGCGVSRGFMGWVEAVGSGCRLVVVIGVDWLVVLVIVVGMICMGDGCFGG